MTDKDVQAISRAAARGIRKVLPDLRASTGVREDLVQSAWVRVLKAGLPDTKTAYNAGRRVAKDWLRTDSNRASLPDGPATC